MRNFYRCLHNVFAGSLKNHGVEDLADQMFDVGRETMELPFEEKMKFWQGNSGGSFGLALFVL